MIAAELLARLDGVHPRGTGRWSSHCPAHEDRSPSLSIREGADGRILLHDFGGCTPGEIVAALSLELKDLFADTPLSKGQRPAPKPVRVDRLATAFRFEISALEHRLHAERILDAAFGLDIAELNDCDLDRAIHLAAHAHHSSDRADLFEDVADALRTKAWGVSQCKTN